MPGSEPAAPDQTKPIFFEPPADQTSPNALSLGNAPEPSVTNAAKMITWDDVKTFHKKPCVRDSYLYGMGAGFALAGMKLVLGGGIPRACNWAVGTFVGTSLVSYEVCQARRRKERAGMLKAVEIIETKKAEKEAKRRELMEKRKAEEEAAAAAASRPWYKVW